MSEEPNIQGELNVARAHRLWVATDTASYYRAFVDAARKAKHCILILAWDLDTRVELLREDTRLELLDLLVELATERPELQIRVLCWNGAFIYALEREIAKSLKFAMSAPANLRFEHDDTRNQDIAKHQKIVVVDDAVAFSGGVDLTRRRWDVGTHAIDDPRRVDTLGTAYGPFHDVQAAVDGPCAGRLGLLARERWEHVTGERIPVCETNEDPWPDVEPDLLDVEVTICRTRPGQNGGKLIEVEERYVEMIAAAKQTIYIETQYLTSARIRDSLVERLEALDGPEIVVVTPRATDGLTEQATMNVLRWEVIDVLRKADVNARLRIVYPRVREGERIDDVYVHSKVCVVDDEWLHVGSANLTTRSLRLDFECDLSVRATSTEQQHAIRRARARLLGVHLGRPVEQLVEHESLHVLLDGQDPDAPRALMPLEDTSRTRSYGFEQYADRSQPLQAQHVAEDLFPDVSASFPFMKVGLFLAGTIALATLWRYTALSEIASPDQLASWFAPFRQSWWGPPLATAGFAILSAVGVPATILILACGIAMGTLLGSACALTGAVLGAFLTFQAGRSWGSDVIERLPMSQGAGGLRKRISERGFLAIAALRIVPVAPFVVINLIAGASDIARRDFLLATLLAMAPGTVLMVYYGNQLAEFIGGASIWTLIGIAAIVVGIIAVGWWVERTLDRPRREATAGGLEQ